MATIKPLHVLIVVLIVLAIAAGAYLVYASSVPVVASGDNVSVYYTGTLTNGTQFGSNVGQQPLNFTVGAGQVIPGFDQGVIGMKLNQTKTITIPASAAYGPVNPNLIISVSLKNFGNQTVHVGMPIVETSASGQHAQGIITAMNSTNATINFNPPLAGQTLIFSIRVVSIKK